MNRQHIATLVVFFALVIQPVSAQQQTTQPRWPTLGQQLERDRVIPGSALDRLIRENQDFGMLRASEVNDKILIPLWLRVLWRKSHPELEYRENDPTGGYPLFLQETWEWLLNHQDLRPGEPEVPSGPGPLAKVATVAGNLRTSGAQTAPRSESNRDRNRRRRPDEQRGRGLWLLARHREPEALRGEVHHRRCVV